MADYNNITSLHRDGAHLKELKRNDTTSHYSFRDVELASLRNTSFENFQSARKKLSEGLVSALSCRYSDSIGVVDATEIADFTQWPSPTEKEAIKKYGDDHLDMLLMRYQNLLPEAATVKQEWFELKQVIYNRFNKEISKLSWERVNNVFPEFINILQVMDLILTLPASSAEAERGFSHMKLIKSNIRSRLTTDSLRDLLRIKLESSDIKAFDPKEAVELWQSSSIVTGRNRRPDCIYFPKDSNTNEADSSKIIKMHNQADYECSNSEIEDSYESDECTDLDDIYLSDTDP